MPIGQRPLFISRCAWGATAGDAGYNGGIVVNSGNVTAVQRYREFEISRRSIVSFTRKPVSRDGLYDHG